MFLRSSEITLFVPCVILCKYLCSLTKKSKRKRSSEYADYHCSFSSSVCCTMEEAKSFLPHELMFVFITHFIKVIIGSFTSLGRDGQLGS